MIILNTSSGKPPNGSHYPLVGGTRQRHFDGTGFKPGKLLESAQTSKTVAARCVGRRFHCGESFV